MSIFVDWRLIAQRKESRSPRFKMVRTTFKPPITVKKFPVYISSPAIKVDHAIVLTCILYVSVTSNFEFEGAELIKCRFLPIIQIGDSILCDFS